MHNLEDLEENTSSFDNVSRLGSDDCTSVLVSDLELRDIPISATKAEDGIAFATLDAISHVVGETFGQRDLLTSRDRLWKTCVCFKSMILEST